MAKKLQETYIQTYRLPLVVLSAAANKYDGTNITLLTQAQAGREDIHPRIIYIYAFISSFIKIMTKLTVYFYILYVQEVVTHLCSNILYKIGHYLTWTDGN